MKPGEDGALLFCHICTRVRKGTRNAGVRLAQRAVQKLVIVFGARKHVVDDGVCESDLTMRATQVHQQLQSRRESHLWSGCRSFLSSPGSRNPGSCRMVSTVLRGRLRIERFARLAWRVR